ncbi:hypothetical protein SE17_17465 [Kouleothrix aurantiaca]|uniref:WxL Interacting Protein peptidoglycan binding domain-containing protein n=1 Tax=Kouleothrix aurantiaca TaxID=186479 RepID=A0A0N8PS95_9CHLR|nr:hypothetical protein SE17_17465 [Kouleothrix aurantiaca]
MYRCISGLLLKSLAILSSLLFFLGSVGAANAQTQPAMLGIKPVGIAASYFTLTMAPGETRELTVELANFSTVPVRARTYAADAYTIVNGGFGIKLDGEPSSGATRWLDYSADTLELAPRAGVNRTFTIHVPSDAKPGDYITGLAIQSADAQPTNSTGIAIRQVVRQAIAIAITLPGPQTPRITIGAATYRTVAGTSLVAVAVTNSGNVNLKPKGAFVLRAQDGTEVSRYPLAIDMLYAGTSTFIEVPFAGRLDPGAYAVALELADDRWKIKADAPSAPLSVPRPEEDGPAPAIGTAPQPAQINHAASQPTNLLRLLPSVLAGGCFAIGLILLGLYGYRRKQRGQAAG